MAHRNLSFAVLVVAVALAIAGTSTAQGKKPYVPKTRVHTWTFNTNQSLWNPNQIYRIDCRDTLKFNFTNPRGRHDIIQVSTAFLNNGSSTWPAACTATRKAVVSPLINGTYVYTFAPFTYNAKHTYICDVPTHCSAGYMALTIQVVNCPSSRRSSRRSLLGVFSGSKHHKHAHHSHHHSYSDLPELPTQEEVLQI
mmetsp:Transcript_37099/g.82535  ORF Transcript_37099/g.82535 Transcript_37099/m.82535 type:complete len:196 (+) Transcript_37099:130-717(+)|eukprot:CAMPEP_0202917666 /NCGR_PEP_ID=MMETSP1392-20130828/71540_1 /ASSEMBLY_ACC=CAM_ASM_000868 /TAXON_ID=225041 /ORGANISM="Chlamydomonas chlamydogama, Strain SAG 11-48b" /LENGTH=195 /DNA_ID=CAMNT_0049610485 /DNA_START=145 /DNA_END=732 /DNA_ORIENTATION=+